MPFSSRYRKAVWVRRGRSRSAVGTRLAAGGIQRRDARGLHRGSRPPSTWRWCRFDAETGLGVGPSTRRDNRKSGELLHALLAGWSARFAFESSRGAGRHIWRVDIGVEPVQLTSDPNFEETFPQWSPGRQHPIAFHPANLLSLRTPRRCGSWIRTALTLGRFSRATISRAVLPDGSGSDLPESLMNLDLPDTTSRSYATGRFPTQPERRPSPCTRSSPDGRWIAYQATGQRCR